MWKLNTSNRGKFAEFQKFFLSYGIPLENTDIDLKEIEADPIQVIAQKASSLGELTLVEDTCLEIDGIEVGINIRWLLENLSEYVNRKAIWKVFLAYREDDKVYIFKGEVKGIIVESRGKSGFGFDSFFLPEGSEKTLGEAKLDKYNARYLAVEAFIKREIFTVSAPICDWKGKWQQSNIS